LDAATGTSLICLDKTMLHNILFPVFFVLVEALMAWAATDLEQPG
jgi:hypothetical protein